MKHRLEITYILNLIDGILTYALYQTDSNFVEGNLFCKFLLNNGGFLLYKIAIVGVALLLIYRYRDKMISKVTSFVVLAVYILLILWWAVYLIM